MKKMMMVAALLALAGMGCTKKKKEEGTGGPTGSNMAGSGSSMAGSGSAMTGSGSAAMAKPMSGEDLAKRYDECWGYFNDAKWDDFKGCYTADAVFEEPGSGMPNAQGQDGILTYVKTWKDAFPDMKGEAVLELVNGHDLAGVVYISGTNNGPMKTPMGEMPATKNKVGLMMSQYIELDDAGHVKHEWDYLDLPTLMGQLKPDAKHPVRPVMDKAPMAKEVVVAKDDDKEKANAEVAKKFVEAFNKHDAKALGDVIADDITWSEQAMPKDDKGKKEFLAMAQAFWKGFSDAKLSPEKMLTAGDYFAGTGVMDATNDGDMPAMHMKKTGKKMSSPHMVVMKIDNGKVKDGWLFEDTLSMAQQLGMMPAAGAGRGAPAGEKKDEKKPADKKADKKPEKKG
ncbi:MAG: ester cyclase [Acidobacteriota bacterium]